MLVLFQCDPAKAIKALFDALWAGPRYLLVFGGACPPVMGLLARSLPALALVQVSPASLLSHDLGRGLHRRLQGFVSSSDVSGVLHCPAPQPVQQEVVREPVEHGALRASREPGRRKTAAALQVEESRPDHAGAIL